jgi:hypothetical protein
MIRPLAGIALLTTLLASPAVAQLPSGAEPERIIVAQRQPH